ncbi:phage regulatory CII family protein [Photobacterium salinisoli]|uniref:phage regulatory CII family protein n=1 Tax=Photobacterium salinisoli TaxID=1616783 RepID=UPI001F08A5A1|nr:phage regulatory CII family protein [Photobacterium salinisoli]
MTISSITPMREEPCYPQVVIACRETLRQFNNTCLLEHQLNKRAGVLANEINPNQKHHKLGLMDAITLMKLTGDVQILRALAAEMNHSIYFLANYQAISDLELLNSYSNWHAEVGDVNRELSAALADGDIQREEFERIERALQESFAAALEFLSRVRALVVD